MKSTVENLSDTRVKLTVEIPFEDLQDSIQQAYKRIASQVNVPGFRRGKVPTRIIDQRFGRGVVLEEVVNAEVPKAYDEAVRSNELRPLGQPEVEVTQIEDGELIAFTAEVDVTPQFDLPDYKGLEVEVSDSVVSDEDVDEQVEQLRKRFATVTPVERAAETGDLVLVDVKGELDGEELEDFAGTALTFEVGAEGMIEGFSEAVTGKSEGDTVTFDHTPDEGPYEGKSISVTVDLKGVRERTLPEADDEFAQLASEFDTVAELRDDLRTKLQGNRLVEQGYEAREKLAERLLELVDFPLPEAFLQAQIGEHFADGHGDDEHRAEVEENTRQSLKTQLVLDKIADTEDLGVEQAELIQWLVQQAPRYGMSADQFANALAEAGQVGTAVADVRRGKALALVMQEAKVTDASGKTVDLSALDAGAVDDLADAIEDEILEEEYEEAAREEAAEAEVDADK
ncbi:MAG: trigger factor [Actinobacteria bacterium]|nr:trigger factor [Actinomycetota bacterium]